MLSLGDALSKAIPDLHHSQTQQRSKVGRFARQHHSQNQPRNARGRFRGRLTLDEREAAATQVSEYINDQLSPRLQEHLSDFERGRLTAVEWYDRCERDIRLFYDLSYRAGQRTVGHPASALTPQDKAVLNRVIKDELHYLKGFQTHLETGQGKLPYHVRAELYAQAAREAAWMGWVMGDQRKSRAIRWMRGPTNESCSDCVRFEAMGWQPATSFVKHVLGEGYLPQSGKLECQGHHCRCYLEERVDGVVQKPVLFSANP